MFITLDNYFMGRDKQYASELTEELRNNAKTLLPKVNALLADMGLTAHVTVTSGWRPAAINAATKGAAKKSNHMLCLAVDIADANGSLKKMLAAKPELLVKHGLYMEDAKSAPTWLHVQCVAPKSGKRIFIA